MHNSTVFVCLIVCCPLETLNNPNVRKKHNSFGEYEAAKLPHLNNAQGEDDDAASTQNSFQSSSHMMSVTSLLALKRERIEQQRRATIKAADDFSHSKSKESVDHARRTLNVLSHKQRMSGKTLPSKLM